MSRHLDPPEDLIGGGFVEVALPGVFAPQQDPSGIGKRKGSTIYTAAHHKSAARPKITRIKIEIFCFGKHEVLARRQGGREKAVPELEDPLLSGDLEPRLDNHRAIGTILKPEHTGIVQDINASRTEAGSFSFRRGIA
jgi:hypothetical protein